MKIAGKTCEKVTKGTALCTDGTVYRKRGRKWKAEKKMSISAKPYRARKGGARKRRRRR